MPTIPQPLMAYVEVAFDGAELLAHRRGPAEPPPVDDRRMRASFVQRHAPRCRPDSGWLPLMSAYRATELEAEACPDPACFGPGLPAAQAAGQPDPWHCQTCGHHWPPTDGQGNTCPQCGGRGGFHPARRE